MSRPDGHPQSHRVTAPHAADPRDQISLTHVREDGSAHMVDVSDKDVTARSARAQAVLHTRPDVTAQLAEGALPKGDALATARIAGIMAAKRTSELVPLCHPLPITKVTVDFEVDQPEPGSVAIAAEVRTTSRTGVEIEALTAVSVAAVTLYDMIKAVDRAAVITDQQVIHKAGGRQGEWTRHD